jgi:hypothetical protein
VPDQLVSCSKVDWWDLRLIVAGSCWWRGRIAGRAEAWQKISLRLGLEIMIMKVPTCCCEEVWMTFVPQND